MVSDQDFKMVRHFVFDSMKIKYFFFLSTKRNFEILSLLRTFILSLPRCLEVEYFGGNDDWISDTIY